MYGSLIVLMVGASKTHDIVKENVEGFSVRGVLPLVILFVHFYEPVSRLTCIYDVCYNL